MKSARTSRSSGNMLNQCNFPRPLKGSAVRMSRAAAAVAGRRPNREEAVAAGLMFWR